MPPIHDALPPLLQAKLHPLEPPETVLVPLSFALTWIAFNKSMSCDELARELIADEHTDFISNINVKIIDALEQMIDMALAEKIKIFGYYCKNDTTNPPNMTTDGGKGPPKIEPQALRQFKQYDIIHDGLRRGNGWAGRYTAEGFEHALHHNSVDAFHSVEVHRGDLLNNFKAEPLPPFTHNELVKWCKDWQDAGKGGEDKAWPVFQVHPRRGGVSREHGFRPAFREARRQKA